MTYRECSDDFVDFPKLLQAGTGKYALMQLKEFKTELSTPALVVLYKDVEHPKGNWSVEPVDCVYTDNPSDYLKILNPEDYKFAALEIKPELNDLNTPKDRKEELIEELKGIEFNIRAELGFKL